MNLRIVSNICIVICLIGGLISEVENMGILIVIFILGFLISLALSFKLGSEEIKVKQTNRAETIKQYISDKGVHYSQIIFGVENRDSLSFDEYKEQLYFSNGNELKQYSFSDILESRIEENGESITRTSRSSQITGALVGGLIAGPLGEIIGATTAQKKNITKIKSIELVIIVDDTKHPIHKLKLFSSAGVSPTNVEFKEAKEQAEHWHGLISVFIRRADNKGKVSN